MLSFIKSVKRSLHLNNPKQARYLKDEDVRYVSARLKAITLLIKENPSYTETIDLEYLNINRIRSLKAYAAFKAAINEHNLRFSLRIKDDKTNELVVKVRPKQ